MNRSNQQRSIARRRLLRWALAAPVAALASHGARGQSSLNRPVRLIVPFAAGGPADTMTRAAGVAFSTSLNQPVIVENRPGAGGNIAAAYVAGAPADGHTILIAGQAILAINKPLYGNLTFDPERDFSWVGMLGSAANVLVAHPEAVPARNMTQFIELARSQPKGISYGSNGVGSLSHLTTEVMARAAGVSFLHVPYQGAAPQRADLLAGRIGFSFIATSTSVPLVREGRLRALAVSTGSRIAALPDTPTLVESGFPMLDAPTWFAAVAHASTPPQMLAELRTAFNAAIASGAYGGEMERQSSSVMVVSPDAAEKLLARERKLWADAVRTTGATASS